VRARQLTPTILQLTRLRFVKAFLERDHVGSLDELRERLGDDRASGATRGLAATRLTQCAAEW
jgi:hypothetical protein